MDSEATNPLSSVASMVQYSVLGPTVEDVLEPTAIPCYHQDTLLKTQPPLLNVYAYIKKLVQCCKPAMAFYKHFHSDNCVSPRYCMQTSNMPQVCEV